MFTGQGAQYTNMTEDLYLKNNFYAKQIDLWFRHYRKTNRRRF